MRDTTDIVLWFNIRQAGAAGIKFYVSKNRVILTEGADGTLPMQYLKSVQVFMSGEDLPAAAGPIRTPLWTLLSAPRVAVDKPLRLPDQTRSNVQYMSPRCNVCLHASPASTQDQSTAAKTYGSNQAGSPRVTPLHPTYRHCTHRLRLANKLRRIRPTTQTPTSDQPRSWPNGMITSGPVCGSRLGDHPICQVHTGMAQPARPFACPYLKARPRTKSPSGPAWGSALSHLLRKLRHSLPTPRDRSAPIYDNLGYVINPDSQRSPTSLALPAAVGSLEG